MSARSLSPIIGFGGVATIALALSGCGFTPLYATPGMTPALASVDVVTPQTRGGYLVKQQLNEELARDAGTPALYRLTIALGETRYPRGLRVNNVATRYELGVTASYVLTDEATGRVLLQSTAPAQVSYDSADPPYAGTQANQDGEARLAEQVAVRIRLDLSRYFERQAYPAAPTSVAAAAADAKPQAPPPSLAPPHPVDPQGAPSVGAP